MGRTKGAYPSIYKEDINKILNLKPKEYLEMNYRIFGSFRVILTTYLRKISNNEFKIRSIRVDEKTIWIFKVPNLPE